MFKVSFIAREVSLFVGAEDVKPQFNTVLVEYMTNPKLFDRLAIEYVSHRINENLIIIVELFKVRNSLAPFNCCSELNHSIDCHQICGMNFQYCPMV